MYASRGVSSDGYAPLISVDVSGKITRRIGLFRAGKATAEELGPDGINNTLLGVSEGLRSPNIVSVARRKLCDDHANPAGFDGEVGIVARRFFVDGIPTCVQLEVSRCYRSCPGIVGRLFLGGAVHNLATVRVEHWQILEGVRPGTIRSWRERHLVAIGLPTRTAIYGVLESHGETAWAHSLCVVVVIPRLGHCIGRRVVE